MCDNLEFLSTNEPKFLDDILFDTTWDCVLCGAQNPEHFHDCCQQCGADYVPGYEAEQDANI